MRLFHNPLSSNARRVLLTAHILETPLELVDVKLLDPADRKRLAELNPNGKVPVLQDGDFILWESCAIMQYLADLTPGQELYPQDLRARADVNRWMFWATQHFFPAVGVLTFQHIWKGMRGMGAADPRELERGEREILQFATVLDNHLQGRMWVAGSALSLADLSLAPAMTYVEPACLPLERFKNIGRWFAQIEASEAWQRTDAPWPPGLGGKGVGANPT